MELVKYELNVPKEAKDVIDLIAKIFDEAKDGVQVDDIAKILPQFMAAVQGVENVKDEIKGPNKDDLMAYMAKVIGEKFE